MSGALRARAPRARALGVIAALITGFGVSVAGAPAAVAAPELPAGATASSRNVSLVANLPKSGAFAAEDAFNSDLAFQGHYAYAGNYNGFTVYDIKNPRKPREVSQTVCLGSQNDISVSGRLLFLSVDSRRNNNTCSSRAATAAESASGAYWEGIRIFDISNPRAPQYVAGVETDCGSHTHTLVPSKDGKDVYVYVSSYGPSAQIAKCPPPHDKISVVKVPVLSPADAAVVSEPVLFPGGGNPGLPVSATATSTVTRTSTLPYSATAGCHDITAYPAKGIAAGACMGEGVIMDITDPVNPKVVESVLDTKNFSFWHSATFNNAADKVVFTDELGGGGAATCNPTVGPNRGANAIYTLDTGRQLELASYYKIAREQASTENCVAHNGSLIPVQGGGDVMVQAWYQGGISIFDFTDADRPRELGWFDRGALSTDRLIVGGSWSAYYYNGYIFSNDIQKGLDVLQVRGGATNGKGTRYGAEFNPQTQPAY